MAQLSRCGKKVQQQAMTDRRRFLKRTASTFGLGWMGYEGYEQFVRGRAPSNGALVFRNDAPLPLDEYSRRAEYWTLRGRDVECLLCPHGCVLGEGDRGFCRTRVVDGGVMHTVAYGNLCAFAVDPVEKKPLYHFLPQTPIVSVAMAGCNLRCPNCQNWQISQAKPEEVMRHPLLPEALVTLTKQRSIPSIAFTYTEPMVCFEYVRDTASLAREAGIKNVLVTAGYVNEEPVRELAKVVDAVQLDVKGFDEAVYRGLARGRLAPVLRTLALLWEQGVWVEVSWLMVSEWTDKPQDVATFAKWIVSHLGAQVPLHLLRFHPAHRMTHTPPTSVASMQRAWELAKDSGLQHVYLGNVPSLGGGQTRCPHDGQLLIERRGYQVVKSRVKNHACPACGTRLAGVF